MICLNDCVFFHLNEFSFRGAFLTLPLPGPVIKPFKRVITTTRVGKKGKLDSVILTVGLRQKCFTE